MKLTTRLLTILAFASIGISSTNALHAGEITLVTPHSGIASIAATSVVAPVAPNNDDVPGLSPNDIWVTQKNYFAIGPVDLVMSVINSGGTTEYAIREGVYNNTTLPWIGYHIELGFGFGGGFVKSLSGDGLDFDAPSYSSPSTFNPSPGFFPTVVTTEDDIIASGGVMPYLSFAGDFRFNVDVPDGITEFTIRQSPIAVPEPGTVGLIGLSLLGLIIYKRR